MMHAQGKKLYPFILEPIFKYRIWGGRKLETLFSKKLPPDELIGESWEISCRGEDNSVIRNGGLAGKTLRDVLEEYSEALLGVSEAEKNLRFSQEKVSFPQKELISIQAKPRFPLLNKFIDANELLSVQVHPGPKDAARFPGAEAKTEAWYILHAEPGATLVKGLKPGVTRRVFEDEIRKHTVPEVLNIFPVFSGDTVFVPAGCVHAMGAGLVVCEIQENSDTTFRVYDWDRVGPDGKPRQLHIEQALEVINFEDTSPEKVAAVDIMEGANRRRYLVACPHFSAELLELEAPARETTGLKRFDTYMLTDGAATIKTEQYADVTVSAGDSVLIPASVGEYMISPSRRCTMIKVYVPDIETDVAGKLHAAGAAEEQIRGIIFE